MAEQNNTQIREAENKVKIEGLLKEIRLEEKEGIISGDVIILTGTNSEVACSVYVAKKTKDGNENKAYKGVQTVMQEYVSLAALMTAGKSYDEASQEATKVRVNNGKLSRQEFYTPTGEFVSNARISSNFFNRVIDDSFEPKAEFEIECYFEKIRKEIKNSEETGRIIVDAIVPVYGGNVVPMEFVAESDIADHLEAHYVPRRTGLIWGEIINIVERTVVKKSGFGKDKEDIVVNFKRELKITGGDEEQYDTDSIKAYTTEQIQKAWKIRETETLPAMLKKSQDRDKGKSTSNAGNKTNPPANTASGFKF